MRDEWEKSEMTDEERWSKYRSLNVTTGAPKPGLVKGSPQHDLSELVPGEEILRERRVPAGAAQDDLQVITPDMPTGASQDSLKVTNPGVPIGAPEETYEGQPGRVAVLTQPEAIMPDNGLGNAVAEVTECQPSPGADVDDIVGCSEQMPENGPGKVVVEVTECQPGPGADADDIVCRPNEMPRSTRTGCPILQKQ